MEEVASLIFISMKYLALDLDANKQDGIGAQMMRRLFIWSYCQLYDNIKYVHVPFIQSSHHPENLELGKKIEEFFNLGQNELTLDDVDKKDVTFLRVCKNGENCIPRCFHNNSDMLDGVVSAFREKFLSNTVSPTIPLEIDKDKFNVAIHCRRGDLLRRDGVFKSRAYSDEYYLDAIEYVKSTLLPEGKQVQFTMLTEDAYFLAEDNVEERTRNIIEGIDIFQRFRNIDNLDIKINNNVLEDMWLMFNVDCIIASRSTFGKIPSLFNDIMVVDAIGKCPFQKRYWSKIKDPVDVESLDYYTHSDFKVQ